MRPFSYGPRILIVAPNASSRFGGEAYLPLKYFEILRRRGHPAKLIAHARNRVDLEATARAWSDDIHFVEDTFYHRAIWKMSGLLPGSFRDTIGGTALNLVNEICQITIIRRLVGEGTIDVIHQPIPVSPLAPSLIRGFGVPVIIGPMNGGMTYPKGFDDLEGPLAQFGVRIARTTARVINRIMPGKRDAAILLVANQRTRQALPFPDHPNIIHLVENGVDFSTWRSDGSEAAVLRAGEGFRLVFMGRLVRWKLVNVTLEAVARARAAGLDVRIDILGDGPERCRLITLADALGLGNVVRFHGYLPQAECAMIAAKCHALILNSVRECGGAVVLEAMALGLPVIGPDWGGPSDYVDESCGLLVSPTPRETFAARLADAIARLATDPALCRRMGQAGAAKARSSFDWEKKVDRFLELCRSLETSGSLGGDG